MPYTIVRGHRLEAVAVVVALEIAVAAQCYGVAGLVLYMACGFLVSEFPTIEAEFHAGQAQAAPRITTPKAQKALVNAQLPFSYGPHRCLATSVCRGRPASGLEYVSRLFKVQAEKGLGQGRFRG